MKFGLSVVALGLAWPGLVAAQQCYPTDVSIGWTQPNNVAISDQLATRWPRDASVRLAYGGDWCPDAAQFELQTLDGALIPAQVRIHTPLTIVENTAKALTIVDVDPIPILDEREDYRVVVRPPNPSLPAFEEYIFEFRTSNKMMDPIDANGFEGVRSVALASDTCSEDPPFEAVNANNPACLVSSKFRLRLEFQPLNRAELSYAIYRTSTTPLDEAGDPIALEADNTRVGVGVQPGSRDVTGTGVPIRPVIFEVLYAPLPRRDCFNVMILDEWGRERGDVDNIACIDLVIPEPCPRGCEGMECQVVFPEPNPFETNPPLPGQACESVGLNGGDPDRPIPPVGEEPEPEGGGEGGAPGDDAGVEPEGTADGGTEGGGGGGGCSVGVADAPSAWWLALVALVGIRRRR